MSSTRRSNKNYLSGLISDPFIRGKGFDRNTNYHAVQYKTPFYRAIFFWLINVLGFFVMAIGIGYMLLNYSIQGVSVAICGIAIFAFTYLMSFLARKHVRCPLCKAHTLVDGKSYKHDKAFKVKPLSYNSTACATILVSGKFRCMHCSTPFDLTKSR